MVTYSETQVLQESQYGFRTGRKTTDLVLALRLSQEWCREKRMPLWMCFVDLVKAYDKVSRAGLYAILEKLGYPPQLVRLIENIHDGQRARVVQGGDLSDESQLRTGFVKAAAWRHTCLRCSSQCWLTR
jgi:hypothetical protein